MSAAARISEPDASAAAASAGMKLRVVYRDGAGEIHLDWPRERIAQAIADRQGTLWVDIENAESASTREAETLLRDDFGFHALAVEDAIDESHIPKIDDWGEYIYLVFHGTSIDPRTDVLRLHELDIFLGLNYVVTYHTEPLSFLDQDRKSIERDPRERLQHGADHLLVRFLERAVDQSLETIEHLDDRVDTVQNQVIADPRPKTLERIFRLKRSAVRLQKIFSPQREVLNRLARDPYKPIRAEHRVYFRDVYDHVVRIHDISESLRDPDRRHARDLPLGHVEPHQRHHEDADDGHRHVHADVVSGRLLRHELLRRDPGVPVAAAQTPALLRIAAHHVRIAIAHVGLCAAEEVVLRNHLKKGPRPFDNFACLVSRVGKHGEL